MTTTTVDAAEVAKFEAMAADWWDPTGKFKPLHMLNPCRLDYICAQIAAEFGRDLTLAEPFKGLRLLDIGCGGGLLSRTDGAAGRGCGGRGCGAAEHPGGPSARRTIGAGDRLSPHHGRGLAAAGEQFDVVLNMEVVEHVADPQAYLTACQQLLKPGGLMICSTLNRNPKSFVMAIVGAEWVMRWLPKGTHDWRKFITPDELYELIERRGPAPGGPQGDGLQPGDLAVEPVGPRPELQLRDRLGQGVGPPTSARRRGPCRQGHRYRRGHGRQTVAVASAAHEALRSAAPAA